MTPEESVKFYEMQQEYRLKCEEFRKELSQYLEHYKPRNYDLKT